MLIFQNDLKLKLQNVVQESDIILPLLRDKKFRVSDTSLTYRQINSLDEGMILESERDSKKGWRKFSLKDLVYLQIIMQARFYGIANKNLKSLKKQFYNTIEEDKTTNIKIYTAEYAIMSSFIGVRTSLIIDNMGDTHFLDPDGLVYVFGSIKPEKSSFLYFNMNKIVDSTLKLCVDKTLIQKYSSLAEIIEDRTKAILSKKESEILDIIRNNDYSKVTIVKKGKSNIVYGEAIKDSKKISEKEMLNYFSQRNFSNIQVQKRDGEIVSYKVEDVFKI